MQASLRSNRRLSTQGSQQSFANGRLVPALGAAVASNTEFGNSAAETDSLYPTSPWLDERGLSPNGWYMIDAIATAHSDGIDPERLHNRDLNQLIGQNWSPEVARASHLLLTSAFKLMLAELTSGKVNPKTSQSAWFEKPESVDVDAIFSSLETGSASARSLFGSLKANWKNHRPLIETIARYRNIAASGGWGSIEPGPSIELGAQGPRVEQLAKRLRAGGDTEAINNAATNENPQPVQTGDVFGPPLEQAVIAFQNRHGLLPDGVVGPSTLKALNVTPEQRVEQLTVNLERLRWMPANLGNRHLITNIPDFRMKVFNGANIDIDMPVVIGKKKHKTPVFSAPMNHLVVNPTWTVPRSIANNELVPKEKNNPGYLARSGYEILRGNGSHAENPDHIATDSWYQSPFPYTIRQKAGKRNALGKVKFMLPNPYSIYLHDTPAKKLFSKQTRAFSHGCVRLSRPNELAEYLLGLKGWNKNEVDRAFKSQKTRTVMLQEPLPNHIVYLTAWVETNGTVHFRNDIYDQDKRLQKALISEQQERDQLINKYSKPENLFAQVN